MARKRRREPRSKISGPEALRRWRERTNTSQKQLATLLRFKHNTSISWYELGRLPLTLPTLVELQRITGISAWVLASPEQRLVMRAIVDATPAPLEAAG